MTTPATTSQSMAATEGYRPADETWAAALSVIVILATLLLMGFVS